MVCIGPHESPHFIHDTVIFYVHVHFLSPNSDESQADLDLLLGTDKAAQQRSSALFLLKLKESRRLSQAAIDDIVHDWDGLFSHTVKRLQARVKAKLATAGIDVDGIEGLQEVFQDVPNPFDGLQTRHMQEKYYHESLGLVVSNPFPIKYKYCMGYSI